MKVQINSIDYQEYAVKEMASPVPVGFARGQSYANCSVHLENGDILEYKVIISYLEELSSLLTAIRTKVEENLGQLNATTR